uniref:HAT C-terminal dimerisation domain-containing protein n=1 Tax=Daphnia galeata TaxID=27404 RepID=A0A8J2RMA2_9CRUS|nr:unnamed protein product [Daphnia galeata]
MSGVDERPVNCDFEDIVVENQTDTNKNNQTQPPDKEEPRKKRRQIQENLGIITIISDGFGSGLKKKLVEKLKKRWFSVIIDETTDVTVDSQLAVMVQYWDPAESEMIVDVLDFVKCTDATADGLSKAVIERLDSLGIRSRFVGFCADTCNVMFGKNHSVSTCLSEEFPSIVVVKCSCHSCNLVANCAAKAFPEELETTMKAIFAHFSRSRNFKEFQEFAQVEKHVILSPCQTRWLSFHNSVKRVLEQLQPLILYFTAEVADDKSKSEIDILTYLKHPQTEPFLNFLNYALGCPTEFNTVFQSESPLLHELEDRVGALIKDFASNFMLLDYTRATSTAKIDPWLASKYQPLNKIYLGIIIKSFYIKAILQLQQRFDFSADFYSILQMLIPQNVRDRNPQTLAAVFSRFPALQNSCDSSKAEIEWRSLSVMLLKELGLQTEDDLKILSAEAFWLLVFNLKCSTGCRFPNLSVVVSYLFSLPYSNAIAERLFSFLKLTKTDNRGALKEDTILGLMRMKYFMKNTDTK